MPDLRVWTASDDYPIAVASWKPTGKPIGRVVVLHGVQSHQGWYHGLGNRLAARGFETHFPDRRGSGSNHKDRGHTPSWRRLVEDVGEFVSSLGAELPVAIVGISWGGKLAVLAASQYAGKMQALALLCPGLQPRVGVSRLERLQITLAYFMKRRKMFRIPLSDPALFTASASGQSFIANDPLALREASAGLLAASRFIDRAAVKAPPLIRQPALLMLASEDRIIDNALTRTYFDRIASTDRTIIEYPGAHHTLEFEPNPAIHADDLARWLTMKIGPRS